MSQSLSLWRFTQMLTKRDKLLVAPQNQRLIWPSLGFCFVDVFFKSIHSDAGAKKKYKTKQNAQNKKKRNWKRKKDSLIEAVALYLLGSPQKLLCLPLANFISTPASHRCNFISIPFFPFSLPRQHISRFSCVHGLLDQSSTIDAKRLAMDDEESPCKCLAHVSLQPSRT